MAKAEEPKRVHWYDGADLSGENIQRLKEVILRWEPRRFAEDPNLESYFLALTPDSFKESPYVADFMRNFFISLCANKITAGRDSFDVHFPLSIANPDFWLTDDGRTALMMTNNTKFANELLQRGANPNAQNSSDETALMVQVTRYQLSSVKSDDAEQLMIIGTLLRHQRTDLSIQDNYGHTAFDRSSKGLVTREMIAHEMKMRAAIKTLSRAFVAVASALEQKTGEPFNQVVGACDFLDLPAEVVEGVRERRASGGYSGPLGYDIRS